MDIDVLNDHPIILAFKAGRAFRREGTNWVDPEARKGAIYLIRNQEDELLHFQWRDRTTQETIDDLILFPEDATFQKVAESAWGRTYVLKFSSSNQQHFYWMQDADDWRDTEFVKQLNMMLTDPDRVPIWDSNVRQGRRERRERRAQGEGTSQGQGESSTSGAGSQPSAEGSLRDLTPSGSQPTEEQLAQLRSLIQSMGASAGSGNQQGPAMLLSDILTPANLIPLFTSHPELISPLFPHLPPDLPTPPSPEVLRTIIESPQFHASVRSFDQALNTGMLGGLVRGLGLPEEAGMGIGPFLRAVEEQARQDVGARDGSSRDGEHMDTE